MEWTQALIVTGVLAGLYFGSHRYNAWIDTLQETDPLGGYDAWLVVAGVGYTLAGAGVVGGVLLGWQVTAWMGLILLACFVASGLPMISGDMRRARERRRRGEQVRRWVDEADQDMAEEFG